MNPPPTSVVPFSPEVVLRKARSHSLWCRASSDPEVGELSETAWIPELLSSFLVGAIEAVRQLVLSPEMVEITGL